MTQFFTLLSLCGILSLSAHAGAEQRLISTDASVTELLFALDADTDLVAVDVTSKLPPDYRKLPNVGYHRNLSAEGMLSLKPSYVIGSEHMGPPPVVAALNQAKVPVLQLNSPMNADQIKDNIKQVADAVDRQQQGKQLIQELDDHLAELSRLPLKGERIAFILSLDPTKLRLAGHGTAAESFIDLLGANNVADFDNYRNVSAESLLAMKASIYVIVGTQRDTATEAFLKANPVLNHSPAAEKGQIYAVEGGSLVAGLSVGAIQEALKISHQFQELAK